MAVMFKHEQRLVLLVRSQSLRLRLQHQFPDCTIQTADNIDGLLQHCRSSYGCCGIVDIALLGDGKKLAMEMQKIHGFAMSGFEACLLALEDANPSGTNELLKVGFRGVIQQGHTAKIGAVANRYWETVDWPPQNVTESVISNLPWSPIE